MSRTLIALAFVATAVLTSRGDDKPAAKPFPIELAIGMSRPSRTDRFALSQDGKHVAYTVITPAASPQPGTPAVYAGHRLYVADTATGKVTEVGGEKAASWAASWSPDGTTVAFYSDQGGEVALWVYRVGERAASRLGSAVVCASHHMRPEWTPDGKHILVPTMAKAEKKPAAPAPPSQPATAPTSDGTTVVVRSAGSEREPKPKPKAPADVRAPGPSEHQPLVAGPPAALTAVSAADGSTHNILPAGDRPTFMSAKLSPSGKYLACESALRIASGKELRVLIDLTIVRRADGKVIHKADAVNLDLNIDPTAPTLVTMAWHPTDDRLAYLDDGKLLLVDAASDSPTTKKLPLGDAGGKVERVLFTRDGGSVLVGFRTADFQVENPALDRVRIIPLNDGPPQEVKPPDGMKVWGIVSADWRTAWQPAAGVITAVGVDTATGEQVFVRMPTDGKPAAVSGRSAGRTRIVAAAGDHGRAVAEVENATTAPDFYTLGADFKPDVRLSRAEPRLEGVSVGPVEQFTTKVPAAGGKEQTVRAAVALPPGGKKGDKFPTVVALYPGTNLSGQARSFGGGAAATIPAAVFTTRGYAVLLVDVPLPPFGTPSDPLKDIQAVVLPQVRRAVELGYTDAERIGVIGHSFGGYGAACLVCDTTTFKAAVPMSGLYDLAGMYATQRSDEPATGVMTLNMVYMEQHQGRMGKPLWDDPKRYLDNSPYFKADRIRTPLLLMHGREDTNCPVGEAEKLFNSLARLDRPAQLAVYQGEGHVPDVWAPKNRLDMIGRTLTFLDRHLKPGK